MTAGVALARGAAALAVVALGAATGSASAADADRGKTVFERCAVCHAVKADDPRRLPGPSLAGVIGRPAAQLPDFRYSPALKRSGLTWSDETLDRFLTDPQALVRGTRMPFAGLGDEADRDDVIAYLKRDAAR